MQHTALKWDFGNPQATQGNSPFEESPTRPTWPPLCQPGRSSSRRAKRTRGGADGRCTVAFPSRYEQTAGGYDRPPQPCTHVFACVASAEGAALADRCRSALTSFGPAPRQTPHTMWSVESSSVHVHELSEGQFSLAAACCVMMLSAIWRAGCAQQQSLDKNTWFAASPSSCAVWALIGLLRGPPHPHNCNSRCPPERRKSRCYGESKHMGCASPLPALCNDGIVQRPPPWRTAPFLPEDTVQQQPCGQTVKHESSSCEEGEGCYY